MYDALKKKVIPDTTRIYYIDVWFLTQNLPCYQPETVTSFTQGDGGLQIFVGQVGHGQGVCPLEPFHLSQIGQRPWTISSHRHIILLGPAWNKTKFQNLTRSWVLGSRFLNSGLERRWILTIWKTICLEGNFSILAVSTTNQFHREMKGLEALVWKGGFPRLEMKAEMGRAAVEGVSPTPPRAHWFGPECVGEGGVMSIGDRGVSWVWHSPGSFS